MISTAPGTTAASVGDEPRFRAVAGYVIEGDLRYLSHHDELRMLSRALVRAQWPLRYSQGFNPIPRLVLPLPRSVGMASDCQVAIMGLRQGWSARRLRKSLSAVLPRRCRLRRLTAPAPSGTPHPISVEYVAELDPADTRAVNARLADLLAKKQLLVRRQVGDGKSPRCLDVRPYIKILVLDGSALRMRLCFQQQRTARPSEILTALDLAVETCAQRVRRTEVVWDMELFGVGLGPTAPEGISIGKAKEDDDKKDDDPQS